MRIVFFGTPPFARTILEYLIDHGVDVAAVVTKQDKPTHRSSEPLPSAVKQAAMERGIPCYQPLKASDPAFVKEVLAPLQADVFVVAAFSEILKENLLGTPKKGCINVHASLLPKYRGAAPIQRCLMEGEKESGVTIMAMDPGLDTGAMYTRVVVPIPDDMTAGDLSIELARRGAEALFTTLEQLGKGEARAIPQPMEGSSYAKKLTSEDGRIEWDRPSSQIYNHIRGVTPKPGAWCEVELRGVKKKLRIHAARHHPSAQGKPGQRLSLGKDSLVIACQTGAIALLEVQLEGKKKMDSRHFLNGIADNDLNFSLTH